MKRVIISKPKKKKIETIHQPKQGPISLCSCCNSLQTCTFTRDHGQQILQCEEFDGIILPPPRMMSRKKTAHVSSVPSPSGSLPGLCSLCEDRLTCTYPKPEGGVWHCEEYR